MKYLLIVLTIIAVALTGCAKPTESGTSTKVLSVNHVYETLGKPYDMIVIDDYIFLAEDQGGFSIFNRNTKTLESRTINDGTDNFENIRQLGYAEAIEYIYIFDRFGPASLRTYDITDRANPIYINRQFGGELASVNHFYTESDEDGKTFLAISNTNSVFRYGEIMPPDHPIYPNFMDYLDYPTPNAVNKFHIVGNLVYLAAAQRGMYIFDMLSNTVITELNLTGDALDIRVKGNYAYIAAKEEGLLVVNIQDPINPEWVSTHSTSGWAQSLDIEGDYLAVGSGGGGVFLYDISETPEKPAFLDRMTMSYTDYVYLVALQGGKLYTAGRYKGITEFNIKR